MYRSYLLENQCIYNPGEPLLDDLRQHALDLMKPHACAGPRQPGAVGRKSADQQIDPLVLFPEGTSRPK